MRDIRIDLRERLASLDGRYADEMVNYERQRGALDTAHQSVLEAIKRERAAVDQLMKIENEHADEPLVIERRLVPLMDFLLGKIAAYSPIDKDRLRNETEAAGYFDEGNGRAFHTTLMNIVRGGKVVQLPDGSYAPHASDVSLFGAEQESEAVRIM